MATQSRMEKAWQVKGMPASFLERALAHLRRKGWSHYESVAWLICHQADIWSIYTTQHEGMHSTDPDQPRIEEVINDIIWTSVI